MSQPAPFPAAIPSLVSSSFDGSRAWVYVWLSKAWRVAYVGQTRGELGTVGRSAQHLLPRDRPGFRRSFETETGAAVERAADLVLVSFVLPDDRLYHTLESSYREAVEYNVQTLLQKRRGVLTPPFRIVSKVRYFPLADQQDVTRIATEIVDRFAQMYDTLPVLPP